MEKLILVYVDLSGSPQLVGRLWARTRKEKDSASFEYDKNWLASPYRFSLEPALSLGPGSFHTPSNKPLFGAIGDSAPDRWGRALMRRAERRKAQALKQMPRTLREIDYLLMVDDQARLGALRFAEKEGGPFLAQEDHTRIPPYIELPRLLTAAEHLLTDKETEEDLQLLLAPGSSLGGARPKASVLDRQGNLIIAKFPKPDDEINQILWEALALTLAKMADIAVPVWQLKKIGNKSALLIQRFDRIGKIRIPFLSAMSMLSAADNEQHSYLEFVDALRQYGAKPKEDMHALWRRIVFNILVSNTDDHLRNHGFLYSGQAGWQLSPAYDLNPTPVDIKPRILTTAISFNDNTASLDLALEMAPYFQLNLSAARQIAASVGKVIAKWRVEAIKLGLTQAEIERMSSAFEHEDLKAALAIKTKGK